MNNSCSKYFSVVAMILFGHAGWAAVATSAPAVPGEAAVRLREATLVLQYEAMRYAVTISAVDQSTQKQLLGILDDHIAAQSRLVESADGKGVDVDALVAKAKEQDAQLNQRLHSLVQPEDGAKLDAASDIAGREGILFYGDFAKMKKPDPFPGMMQLLHLTKEQQTIADSLRADAIARHKAIFDEEVSIPVKPNVTFDSSWWELEKVAAGTETTTKFRAMLNPQQLSEWKKLMSNADVNNAAAPPSPQN